MTYIDLINNVLRRLREDTVTTVDESSYSLMVGDFINDAKRLCEDATDWSALRQTLAVTTTQGTFSYPKSELKVKQKLQNLGYYV